eukprot:11607004-Alexandrium_andersonii.AAC.1
MNSGSPRRSGHGSSESGPGGAGGAGRGGSTDGGTSGRTRPDPLLPPWTTGGHRGGTSAGGADSAHRDCSSRTS